MKKRESNRQLCLDNTSRQTRTVCCVHTREHCSFMGRGIHQDAMPAYWSWLVHTEFVTCPAPPCLHSAAVAKKTQQSASCGLLLFMIVKIKEFTSWQLILLCKHNIKIS